MLKRKVILITGITGSLGNELTKHLLEYIPSKIIGISRRDHDQEIMAREFDSPLLRFHIGDVRNYDKLCQSMKGVDFVIHTSASKHIHRGETDALEYKSNIVDAAECVIRACITNNVKRCVALSTDKACANLSVYGSAKSMSDRLFMASNNYSETKFAVIRYGNVLFSNGSISKVMPKGGEIKITDRDMTRFWITIERAAELTIHLLKYMNGGEMFIPKLPSCNVLDMLKVVNPTHSNVVDIGIRSGEKIHESMFHKELSRKVLEFTNNYIVYDSLPDTHHRTFAGEVGTPITEPFDYNSQTNPWKLTNKEIKTIINGEFKWNPL